MAIGPETARAKAAAASRAKVLAAAKALFEHHGYEAVTMRQIAKEIDMSTGVLFSHFSGKAALFEAAVGSSAPDVPAFLEKVVDAARMASVNPERAQALTELALEAKRLRGHLLGHHA